MYIFYNLILHSFLYMFLALKSHRQEDSCKNTNIMVQYISMCVLYGECYMVSRQCEFTLKWKQFHG